MKSKLISIIKNLTLEQINKNLIFVAILSLLFRVGNFATSYLPKPFEIIVILICFLTILDVIKNKKIKEFFYSVPKNIRIALIYLVSSILIGWGVSVLGGVPVSFSMILEFGTFIFSLSIFILIIFYTRNDKSFIKKYFYALLVPVVYTVFVMLPDVAYELKLALGTHFVGFTTNPNIVSKILLIPIFFFTAKTLYEEKSKWVKLGYLILSSLLVSLLFWTSSRGAILSLLLGMIFIGLVFSLNNYNWKKLFKSIIIIFLICLIGFTVTPRGVKEVVVTRISNTEIIQPISSNVGNVNKNKIINNVFTKITGGEKEKVGVTAEDETKEEPILIKFNGTDDLRLQIWSFYLEYILWNPLGVGPNTHMDFHIVDFYGDVVNSGPHSSYLQIWFWGGLLGLSSFIYLLFIAFKNIKTNLKLNFSIMTLSLATIFLSLCVSILFDDSFTFPWFWVILALSLIYKNESKN